MKFLFLLMLFVSGQASADVLLDIMMGRYEEPKVVESEESDENGEHYSWDNLYLCQYCDTEIVVDPYGETYPPEEDYGGY